MGRQIEICVVSIFLFETIFFWRAGDGMVCNTYGSYYEHSTQKSNNNNNNNTTMNKWKEEFSITTALTMQMKVEAVCFDGNANKGRGGVAG